MSEIPEEIIPTTTETELMKQTKCLKKILDILSKLLKLEKDDIKRRT